MSEYLEGPLCGVDNCPSRLWRRANGRSVCQFGHVNEYDVELNDDDNYVEGQPTRKAARIAGLTKNGESEQLRVFAEAQHKKGQLSDKTKQFVRERSLQIILAKQCRFVIHRFGLEGTNKATFLRIIKAFWVHELVDASLALNTITLKVYFALLRTGIPIYLLDFISMLEETTFPYITPHNFLPLDLARLNGTIGKLNTDFLAHMVTTMSWRSAKTSFLTGKKLTFGPYPFVVRLVLHLRLPIEVAVLVFRLIQKLSIRFVYATIDYSHPELALCGLIVGMAKLYFTANPDRYPAWITAYHNSWKSTVANDFEIQRAGMRTVFRHHTSLQSLLKWDTDRIDSFLKYYKDTFEMRHLAQLERRKNRIRDLNKTHELKVMESIFNVEFPKYTKEQKDKEYMDHLRQVYAHVYGPSEECTLDIYQDCPIFIEIAGKVITSMYNCTTELLWNDFRWATIQIGKFIENASAPYPKAPPKKRVRIK